MQAATDRPRPLAGRLRIGLAAFAMLAASCGSDGAGPIADGSDAPAMQCSGTDPAPGIDVSVDWQADEERLLIREATNIGAGVPPDIDGIVLTTPLAISALEADPGGALLSVRTGDDAEEPSLDAIDGVEAQFRVDASGTVVDDIDDPALGELARDIDAYHLVASLNDGETITSATSMTNPFAGGIEDATRTIEHLGIDDQGCEVIRATTHIGPDEVIDDLDGLLEELGNPDQRPEAFADIGFEGAVVQTITYRFDHGINRVRSVEFTQAWGIFGAGGVDTRVATLVLTDVTDQ